MKYKQCLAVIIILTSIIGCKNIKTDRNGRPIQDFINQKKIEVSFINASIQNIEIQVTNRKWHNLSILIPMGAVLSPINSSYQNMLCYADIRIEVNGGEDEIIDIPVVCMNILKKIPESGSTFQFEKHSTNIELNNFIRRLSETDDDFVFSILGGNDDNYESLQDYYYVLQAAVWIITDNASYEELGTLVRTDLPELFGQVRLIDGKEAAEAMILLQKCGIDIKSKKIWQDRNYIYNIMDEDDEPSRSSFKSIIDF